MSQHIFFLRTNEPYGYLSNFYPARITASEIVTPDGVYPEHIVYPTSENCYQAHKATSLDDHILVGCQPSARDSKKKGYEIRLRDDWEYIKTDVMLKVLRLKFYQHNDLAGKLIATGDADLHETYPGDNFWSYNNGKGQDMLGILLMLVREELIDEQVPF